VTRPNEESLQYELAIDSLTNSFLVKPLQVSNLHKAWASMLSRLEFDNTNM
ncbi:hypothetical protein ACJX0J_025358, partial [Zea mays]